MTGDGDQRTYRVAFFVAVVALAVVGMSAVFAGSAAALEQVDADTGVDDGQSPFATIQAAVDNASQGETIEVENGTYNQIVINRDSHASGLTIQAAAGASPTISHSTNNGEPAVAVDQDGITVEGFTITRSTSDSTNVAAQAVRVAGNNVDLSSNDYKVEGPNNNAVTVTTDSSGAAGNPQFTGIISDVTIDGGTIAAGTDGTADNEAGIVVVDGGAASLETGAVTVTNVDFSAEGDNAHLSELDTGGGVVDTAAVLNNNDFDTAASPDSTDASVNGFSIDNIITSDIQSTVDSAAQGATVEVLSGTYQGPVTIGVSVTIDGAGSSSSGTVLNGSGSGTGMTVSASDVTVRDLRITDYSNGIEPNGAISNITFKNVYSGKNGARGMAIPGGADIQDLSLNSVRFNNNTGDGIRASTASKVDGVTVQNSHFNNNSGDPSSSGIEIYQNEDTPGQFTSVLIEDTTFNNNGEKGIYTEKLSDAVFDNITVDGVGSDSYGYNTGIDINLKYSDYQNITIKKSDVRNVSRGDPSDPSFSAAIAVKARDDGSSYGSTPATLDDVTLDTVTVEGSFNGLRIGEAGVDYSGAPSGPTNVAITNSTFRNNERYHVEDLPGSIDLKAVETDNTFDRTVSSEVGIYSSIQAAVDTAEPDDIIEADSGTYQESVTITTQNVTLKGPNAGVAGYESRSSTEAVIEQGVNISADSVTLDGFEITNNGGNGIKISLAPSDVVVTNNRVVDIAGGTAGDQKAFANGINLQFNQAFKKTSSGIEITNNEIHNITTDDMDAYDNDVIGIQLLPRGNDVKDLRIADNVISDVEPGDASDNGRAEARGISIDTQFVDQPNGNTRGDYGQPTNLSINDNEIYNLTSEYSRAITLFEDKGGSSSNSDTPIGPVNFTLTDNTIDRLTSEDPDGNVNQRSTALFLGGYANLGAEHRFSNNNIKEGLVSRLLYGQVDDPESADYLDATENWWDNENGPNGVDTTGVDGRVATQPFLTAPIEGLEDTEDGTPRQFATELRLSGVSTVAFPAPSERTLNETVNTSNVETIYVFDNSERTWLGPGEYDPESEPDALDTFVTVVEEGETANIVMEFDNDFNVDETTLGSTEVASGEWNLVSPTLAADSRTDAFRGDVETDLASENPFQDPLGQPFGAGEVEYSPYRGYWVYVTDGEEVASANYDGLTLDQYLENVNLEPEDN